MSYYDGRQRRALRFRAFSRIKAVLASRPCDVLDISVSGALVLVDRRLTARGVYAFRLGEATEALQLTALTVRTTPSSQSGWWETAIAFREISWDAHVQIAAMLTHLLQTL